MAYGKPPAGYHRHGGEVVAQDTWTLAHNPQEAKDMGFSCIHLDTLGMGIGLAIVLGFLFVRVAKTATVGKPKGLQSFVEMIVGSLTTRLTMFFTIKTVWLRQWR